MFKLLRLADWNRALGVHALEWEAFAVTDASTVHGFGNTMKGPARLEYGGWDAPGGYVKRLGFPGGKRGNVKFSITIKFKGGERPHGWSKKVADAESQMNVDLPFECSSEGVIKLLQSQRISVPFNDRQLSVFIHVYQLAKSPSDRKPKQVPIAEWTDWMRQMKKLRLVIVAGLTITEDGPGAEDVIIHPTSDAAPSQNVFGSTSDFSAEIGRFIIDLEPIDVTPPETTKDDVTYQVHFGVNSAEIDKTVVHRGGKRVDEGKALDAWIRTDLSERWDVREVLLRGKLALRGETRASATGNGLRPSELYLYNQKLSQKRLDAVKGRLKTTLFSLDIVPDTSPMRAIGATKAPKMGEEDVNERRSEIGFTVVELRAAIKEIFGRKYRGGLDGNGAEF